MNSRDPRAGLSLVEVVVVIAVLAILAGALIPRVTVRLASARDARRLSDIHAIRDAIDQYFIDKGQYPAPAKNAEFGGWDVSHDGDFVPELVAKGYLSEVPYDPSNDDEHHYRYYVYEKGDFRCKGATPFYVLGIRTFETPVFAAKNRGFFKCSERDWSDEFAYVTGGGATWKE